MSAQRAYRKTCERLTDDGRKVDTYMYFRGADLPLMNRGDAAAATWIVRGGDESRRRRSRDADIPGRRVARLRYQYAKHCSMHLAGTLEDPWVLDGHWTDRSSQAYVLPIVRPWRLAHDRYLVKTKKIGGENSGPAFAAPDLSGRPVARPGLQKVTVAFAAGLGRAERTRFKLMELRSC